MQPIQAKLTHYQRLMLTELAIAALELLDLAGDQLILVSPLSGTVMLVSPDDLLQPIPEPGLMPARAKTRHYVSRTKREKPSEIPAEA